MAEATFARNFLSSLESRPIKLSPDHVDDPKSYPARPPYILPRMTKPMTKPADLAPGQERSLTVVLKSLRNPPLDIKLTSQPLNTSVLDIKTHVSRQTRIPVDKMKILHNKRPLTDTKVLKDVAAEAETSVDFSVMVIGGAAAIPPDDAKSASGELAGASVMQTDAFWEELKDFLKQRLNDQQTVDKVSRIFRASWDQTTHG
ncbi:hypothetical protein L249_2345 [Ophiocordyceps polyrhachis-furcata BCC 54312]|uniref:Ubiquitin-like domain-containing protein n=1 Tax=Ophiocordyceps polyrhachis-furcata BCC 54312 TaxID=1330021 RepID=A0A367LRT8_9HYPO|nr:hypothetical protein L249_2345 [Ophiocordyceps polyrhachis-furcata BCC 54312]